MIKFTTEHGEAVEADAADFLDSYPLHTDPPTVCLRFRNGQHYYVLPETAESVMFAIARKWRVA